ncbi:MAG: RagB/SusD family nutrient uptake outer membrane protein [Bacteroidaceae bacterium]|nr:RagB/SusD family nutrient uptake outer membrane protein [Bacteroidaceae bacterium]
MKKFILNALTVLALAGGMTSCGDDYLDTTIYNGIDLETGLTNASNISVALNGTYYQFNRQYFAGTYAVAIGDVVSDISYWNGQTGHWNNLYEFTYQDTDTYLGYIWEYGYKVADNAARIIKAANEIYAEASASEQAELDQALAEAYTLRAFAHFYLVNVFAHQVKANGADFSSKPGVVIVDEPIAAFAEVSRSTVGQTYSFIQSDLAQAISLFKKVGDRGMKVYFGQAAAEGLLARVNLYMENWSEAANYAQQALADAGTPALAYTENAYMSLYQNSTSNSESLFHLAINATTNWSANSAGTLWSTYNFSPSPYLKSLYAEGDVRLSLMEAGPNSTDAVPVFNGGKYHHFESNNPAYQTNYMINAPEMYLIIAEAQLKQGNEAAAKEALLMVAKRNPAIQSVDDITGDVMQFIKDERARELFQEGHRLYDLRRWGQPVSVSAIKAPAIEFDYNNYNISEMVLPIPVAEINAGFGVEQNSEWPSVMP